MTMEQALQEAADAGALYAMDCGDGARYEAQALCACAECARHGAEYAYDAAHWRIVESRDGAPTGLVLLCGGTKLELHRRCSRMSLDALSRRSGLSARRIARLEGGERDLGALQARTVLRLARALDTTVESLL